MSTKDEQGKDPENGEQIPNLRKLYDDVLPLGRVTIGVKDKALIEHHVVIPIPKSYEAAMTIVFDQLCEHILPTGGGILGGAYLKYWMRAANGGSIWAKLPPEFWKEIIKDGDMLTLCFPHKEQSAIFVFFKDYGTRRADWVIVPMPKSYEGAVQVALRSFQSCGVTARNVELRINKNGTESIFFNLALNQNNWVDATGSKEFPIEISVPKG